MTPENPVSVQAGDAKLLGDLIVPSSARAVVLFAHGSGSGRHSPRNRYVSRVLQNAGLGTLMIDLLTLEEERIDDYTRKLRFDIGLLAMRIVEATAWLIKLYPKLEVGYFGASTGAAAALVAAAKMPQSVKAIVSRGGRPDLAGSYLKQVKAPTLMIVGGDDRAIIELNERAIHQMRILEKNLVIVPGATHLFEEPGKLEEVATLATEWFTKYLRQRQEHQHDLTI